MQRSHSTVEPIWVWGLPLMPFTLATSLTRIEELIEAGMPSYLITANLHYAMLTHEQLELQAVNEKAAFLLADGMPLVWASRLQKSPLPERVAGADLIWKICEHAARLRWRLYFLGGAPGVAAEAADKLRERYPGLIIAGTDSPPFRPLTTEENAALVERVRQARPHILIVAFGQPKGELWIARNYEKLDVPVAIQMGATLDFVAGKVRRAPRWIQRSGFEWVYRLSQEPRRLLGRYARNIRFLIRMVFGHTRPMRNVPSGS